MSEWNQKTKCGQCAERYDKESAIRAGTAKDSKQRSVDSQAAFHKRQGASRRPEDGLSPLWQRGQAVQPDNPNLAISTAPAPNRAKDSNEGCYTVQDAMQTDVHDKPGT